MSPLGSSPPHQFPFPPGKVEQKTFGPITVVRPSGGFRRFFHPLTLREMHPIECTSSLPGYHAEAPLPVHPPSPPYSGIIRCFFSSKLHLPLRRLWDWDLLSVFCLTPQGIFELTVIRNSRPFSSVSRFRFDQTKEGYGLVPPPHVLGNPSPLLLCVCRGLSFDSFDGPFSSPTVCSPSQSNPRSRPTCYITSPLVFFSQLPHPSGTRQLVPPIFSMLFRSVRVSCFKGRFPLFLSPIFVVFFCRADILGRTFERLSLNTPNFFFFLSASFPFSELFGDHLNYAARYPPLVTVPMVPPFPFFPLSHLSGMHPSPLFAIAHRARRCICPRGAVSPKLHYSCFPPLYSPCTHVTGGSISYPYFSGYSLWL